MKNAFLNKYKHFGAVFFIGVFILSSTLLTIRFSQFTMTDMTMWGHEAEYVLHHDAREFDFLQAYGHPGGPIIEGTIIVHTLLHISYEQAVFIVVILFSSLIITSICAFCLLLRKGSLWWLGALVVLSFNYLYEFSTPPSTIAAILVVLWSLITLYLYENKKEFRITSLQLWAVIAGATIATRADIGMICFLLFLGFLINNLNWKKLILLSIEAFCFFVLFDPFMWFMPVRHIQDLVFKALLHYADFAPYHLSIISVINISALASIAVLLSVFFLLVPKKLESPIPRAFIVLLLLMTVVIYSIYLTSHYQAIRYFLPIIFIWEILLPLFIFSLIEKMELGFFTKLKYQYVARKTIEVLIILLLISQPFLLFIQSFLQTIVFH